MDTETAGQRFQQADELFRQGRHEESLAILTGLNQEFPNQKNIMFAAAKNMEKLGMIDEARFLCQQMIRSFDYDRARRLLNHLEVAPRIAVQAANATDFPADEAPRPARAPDARVQRAEENKLLKIIAVLGAMLLAIVAPVVVIASTLPAGVITGVLEEEQAGELVAAMEAMAVTWLAVGGVALLILHVVFSYLLKRICENADSEPGILIWIPILQVFPVMRAASMRYWWLLIILAPYIGGFVFSIILWVKLSRVCDKSPWWAIPVLMPVVQVGVIMYYAFSDSAGSFGGAAYGAPAQRDFDSGARRSGMGPYFVVGAVALLLILLAVPLVFRSGEESVPQAAAEDAEGQAAAVTSDGRPRGLPPDIPIYPEMEYVHSEPWMTEGALMSVFLTKRTEPEVVAFYDDAFVRMGYDREGPEFYPMFESTFYGYSRGERGILMAFEPDTSLRPGEGYLSVSIMTPDVDDTPGTAPGAVTAQIPAGFPSDVPVYPGLRITSAEANAAGFKVEGVTSDSYDAVTSFYDTALENQGWEGKSGSSLSMPFLGVMEEASKRYKFEPVLRTVELTTKLQNNIVTVIMETSPDLSAFDAGLSQAAVPEPTVIQVEPRPEKTIMLPGNVPLALVEIPEGTFTMGSPETERNRSRYEGPQRPVSIRNSFWLGKHLVTQAQWTAVMGTSLHEQRDKHIRAMQSQGLASHIVELLSELAGEGPEYPMYFISWEECQEFIGKLNAGGQGTFRLPSETEWEYACRAGSTTPYHFGHTDEKLSEYAWNEDTDGITTSIVGQKRPNAWGLYDMIGNVMQWCEDDWHEQYIGAPGDERAWINSPRHNLRLVRGSISGSGMGRSAHRHGNCPPDSRANYFGFRIAICN